MARYDIELVVMHVAGVKNEIADMLSRWDSVCDREEKLNKYIRDPIWWEVNDTHFEVNEVIF